MIESMRMRWEGHVAYIEEKLNSCRCWWKSHKERDDWEGLDIGGRIILKRILEKWDGVVWTGFIQLRIGTSGGFL
jgi:hypothetical protein